MLVWSSGKATKSEDHSRAEYPQAVQNQINNTAYIKYSEFGFTSLAFGRGFVPNPFLSLFPIAGKVTKRAAAADKRLKINSCATQENKLGRRNRPQTYFLI